MSRLEKFRQKRIYRKITIAAVVLFFFLLVTGLLVVDHCINYLLSGEDGFAFIDVRNTESCFEITFMNRKIHLNTQYVNRDLKKIKNRLNVLFNR